MLPATRLVAVQCGSPRKQIGEPWGWDRQPLQTPFRSSLKREDRPAANTEIEWSDPCSFPHCPQLSASAAERVCSLRPADGAGDTLQGRYSVRGWGLPPWVDTSPLTICDGNRKGRNRLYFYKQGPGSKQPLRAGVCTPVCFPGVPCNRDTHDEPVASVLFIMF